MIKAIKTQKHPPTLAELAKRFQKVIPIVPDSPVAHRQDVDLDSNGPPTSQAVFVKQRLTTLLTRAACVVNFLQAERGGIKAREFDLDQCIGAEK